MKAVLGIGLNESCWDACSNFCYDQETIDGATIIKFESASQFDEFILVERSLEYFKLRTKKTSMCSNASKGFRCRLVAIGQKNKCHSTSKWYALKHVEQDSVYRGDYPLDTSILFDAEIRHQVFVDIRPASSCNSCYVENCNLWKGSVCQSKNAAFVGKEFGQASFSLLTECTRRHFGVSHAGVRQCSADGGSVLVTQI
jgi:hypothetical protein